MFLAPETMRILLAACIVAMALLAILFMRRRELTTLEIIGWGLLILGAISGDLAASRHTSPDCQFTSQIQARLTTLNY